MEYSCLLALTFAKVFYRVYAHLGLFGWPRTKRFKTGWEYVIGCKVQTAIAMFYRTHASQLACMYGFGASAGHMCMQGIMSSAMFVVCILNVAYHHLSQYHGGLGISSRSEEPHNGQLSLSLLLFAGLFAVLVGLGSGVRKGTRERPRVEPEPKPGYQCILLLIFFAFMKV